MPCLMKNYRQIELYQAGERRLSGLFNGSSCLDGKAYLWHLAHRETWTAVCAIAQPPRSVLF